MTKFLINPLNKKSKISREIYGHFSEHLGRCIYGGIYVGENSNIPNVNGMRCDVVDAMKKMRIPVLRWPGGCFADEYHWKDGIGPKENRKKMVNTNWGGVVEDNSFGTHEFMELCRQIGAEPYINMNVGSGTVKEMAEWVEYLTFNGTSPMSELRKKNGRKEPWKVKYVGVGNENWGCGGNMEPTYYADLFRRYQTFVKNYGDNKIYKIACGANGDNYEWTDTLMKKDANYMNGLSLHYYTLPSDKDWEHKGSATDFDEKCYYHTIKQCLRMDEIVSGHSKIMDRYDPEKKVGLIVDEWGGWYDVEPGTNPGFLYQQNTMRDAIIAGVTLNIFNEHSDRVKMANIAQAVNVLQSIALTEGSKMLLTPTFYVFDMYKEHQDAELVDSFIETEEIDNDTETLPNLSQSASIKEDGSITATVCNISADKDYDVDLTVFSRDVKSVKAQIIHDKINAYNTFEKPNAVTSENFENVTVKDGKVQFKIPACSVVSLNIL